MIGQSSRLLQPVVTTSPKQSVERTSVLLQRPVVSAGQFVALPPFASFLAPSAS